MMMVSSKAADHHRHVAVDVNGSTSINVTAIGMPISMSMSSVIGGCSRSVAPV
ncbi:hypothetical protein [Bradyrhizobium sp. CSS354]|uniref:hypothetical protein n=2 Tax=Bradyrhizobium TaxID=374 RepID=UPI0023AF4BC4|nr:hypothetical protein [Bradyrhizobium sp. CSS354]MDE5465933.1 hypothetical protein [Bradyrhizobium sp. CSS354]